ncbi:7331_t:CDS:2 [Acaulospora morrowiae]|uniref:Cofilin n=1 Tax=Acaulospora morrowiae TaxID=94023 RepID=A0A9N9C875_9GLOM|nr:7331_t:CDS:2 [Acaulospora morrowiae]
MASGITVSDESLTTYKDLQLGKKHQYIIFKVSDDFKAIVVDKVGQKGCDYEKEFLPSIPDNEPRYIVYDFAYDTEEGRRNKIIFFLWNPDSDGVKSVRQKMIYSSSKKAIRDRLLGISVDLQVSDKTDLIYEEVHKSIAGNPNA